MVSQASQIRTEFQQVIARENNNHGKISNGTDYYIADIEFADGSARFDMVALEMAVQWRRTKRHQPNLSLALIGSQIWGRCIKRAAGIEKHLEDFQAFLSDRKK